MCSRGGRGWWETVGAEQALRLRSLLGGCEQVQYQARAYLAVQVGDRLMNRGTSGVRSPLWAILLPVIYLWLRAKPFREQLLGTVLAAYRDHAAVHTGRVLLGFLRGHIRQSMRTACVARTPERPHQCRLVLTFVNCHAPLTRRLSPDRKKWGRTRPVLTPWGSAEGSVAPSPAGRSGRMCGSPGPLCLGRGSWCALRGKSPRVTARRSR